MRPKVDAVPSRLSGPSRALEKDSLSALDDAGTVLKAAERHLAALHAPLAIAGHEVRVTSSIGAATFPDDAGNADTLLHNADSAMFRAKKKGENKFQFFGSA